MHISDRSPRANCTRKTWLLLLACLCFLAPAWAQQSAARVMAVSGHAKAIDPQGRERTLDKGAELFTGDKVVTAETALVQMRLHDGGYMSIRPGTEMVIERFVHDEKDASNSSFLVFLLRGGFRSITGLIGRGNPAGYQIRSATATVGIRGTDHEPMVILDTPGMQALGAAGLYDKVNEGETFIRNTGGTLSLRPGEVGFAPLSPDTPPRVLPKMPDFYKFEIKTDAREPKDGADDKADGGAHKGGPGSLLRPSVAARREALLNAESKAASGAQAAPVVATPTPNPTTPALTPEQKKTLLQTITAPTAKPDPVTAPATPSTTQTVPKSPPANTILQR